MRCVEAWVGFRHWRSLLAAFEVQRRRRRRIQQNSTLLHRKHRQEAQCSYRPICTKRCPPSGAAISANLTSWQVLVTSLKSLTPMKSFRSHCSRQRPTLATLTPSKIRTIAQKFNYYRKPRQPALPLIAKAEAHACHALSLFPGCGLVCT